MTPNFLFCYLQLLENVKERKVYDRKLNERFDYFHLFFVGFSFSLFCLFSFDSKTLNWDLLWGGFHGLIWNISNYLKITKLESSCPASGNRFGICSSHFDHSHFFTLLSFLIYQHVSHMLGFTCSDFQFYKFCFVLPSYRSSRTTTLSLFLVSNIDYNFRCFVIFHFSGIQCCLNLPVHSRNRES